MSNNIEAAESSYLYVGPSQIPNSGNGLYTAIDIYKEEIIAVFKGDILTDKQIKLRIKNGHDTFFINMLDGTILDSMKCKCFAKYANDAAAYAGLPFKNNAKIAVNDSDQVCLIATRKIKTGDEIFCSYGQRYWDKWRNLMY